MPETGLHLNLAEADLASILHWVEKRIQGIPDGLYTSSDIAVDENCLVITLNKFDVSPAVAGSSFLVRGAAKLIPKLDLPIRIQASKSGDRSLKVQWSIDGIIAKSLLAIGGASFIIGYLADMLGSAVSHPTKSDFLLHLDRLPDPMPDICRPWCLTEASIPGVDDAAMILSAIPA